MPEITFVAKRFFQVSSDAEPVSPENNKTFLTEEVLLTSEIHFFLTKFYECGALNEVDLDLCEFPLFLELHYFCSCVPSPRCDRYLACYRAPH
jgi:hypothetical protein